MPVLVAGTGHGPIAPNFNLDLFHSLSNYCTQTRIFRCVGMPICISYM